MGAPGFDDAPTFRAKLGVSKPIQLVYPYYDNPVFLDRQLDLWATYPYELRDKITAFIVDDGSPGVPAFEVISRFGALPFHIRLFRIDVDVRWNWLAARNIAMHHAKDGWCLLTDMDHMVEFETASRLVCCAHDERMIYRLGRREHTGATIHSHPNSMFMTKAMFWRAGGYDEALSGYYGTDGDWRRRLAATAKVLTLTDQLVRHEFQADSSTERYKRKQPEDAAKKRIIALRGKNWKPKVLSFPYRELFV